jgi:hypothetical protein
MGESFAAKVMNKYGASYQLCDGCGLLAVRDPFWLEEAYSRAIAVADTGLVRRNLELSSKVACVLYWLVGERGEGRYLDLAGGYGLLTRLMRDIGFDFYWSDKYCANLISPGFEFREEMGPCKGVTAFEVLEHLSDPAPFIEESIARHGSEYFIFTTELYEGAPPQPAEWNYYAFATGQHVTFYQRRTLEKLAAKLGLHFASANGLHLMSKVPVSEASLRLVTGPLAPVAALWVRYRLGSRTVRDQELMLGIG